MAAKVKTNFFWFFISTFSWFNSQFSTNEKCNQTASENRILWEVAMIIKVGSIDMDAYGLLLRKWWTVVDEYYVLSSHVISHGHVNASSERYLMQIQINSVNHSKSGK